MRISANRRIVPVLLAAAVLLAALGCAASASAEGWQNSGQRWWYDLGGGRYARNQWVYSGGWYHFDYDGWMQTGWLQTDGHWYYLGNDGAMRTGWQQTDGYWAYLGDDGAARTGWQQIGGQWYLFSLSGIMRTGWQQYGGSWYLLGTDGAMVTGWYQSGGQWYYLRPDGAMAAGWEKIDGVWYCFRPGGEMATGWIQDDRGWYYLLDSGRMVQNESLTIDGVNYLFGGDGRLVTEEGEAEAPTPDMPCSRDNILALLDAYDRDGAYIIRNSNEELLPEWLGSAQTIGDTVNGWNGKLDTAVHEQCHDFCGTSSGGQYNDILDMYTISQEQIYIGNNEYIVVPVTRTFASSEIVDSVPESLRTFRFDTYVNADIMMGSVQNGPYGLLDEWTAYCWGFNNSVTLYPYVKENNLAVSGDNTYTAYAEFKYYILQYMLYAEENYPDVYEEVLNNSAFRQAYVTIDGIFSGLIKQSEGTPLINNYFKSEYNVLNNELQTEAFRNMDALLR